MLIIIIGRTRAPLADLVADGRFLTPINMDSSCESVVLALPKPFRDVLLLARFMPMTQADIASHLDSVG